MYNCIHVCVCTSICVYVQCAYMYVSNRHVCLLYMAYFKEGKELLFSSLRFDFVNFFMYVYVCACVRFFFR